MAFQNPLEKELEKLLEGWSGITRERDQAQFDAWVDWRRWALGITHTKIKGMTVPTEWPPTTAMAAKQYVETWRIVRKAAGWRDSSAELPKDPQPWTPIAKLAYVEGRK